MEFPIEHMQKIKNGVHVFQAVIMFVSWIIMIAVFRSKDAKVDGRPGWFFGLCFLTIPALIYQTMTPLFPRSRKFGNPYAFATVDGVYAVLWFSAFVAVAVWNSAGKCGSGCKISKADVGLGFFIFVCFLATFFMSMYGVMYFRRNGTLPGDRVPHNAAMMDDSAEAFSTAPNDDEYAPVGMHEHDHDPKDDHHHDHNDDMDQHHYDTAYTGGAGGAGGAAAYSPNYGNEPDYGHGHGSPLGMNPSSSYGTGAGRAHFPAGNYD